MITTIEYITMIHNTKFVNLYKWFSLKWRGRTHFFCFPFANRQNNGCILLGSSFVLFQKLVHGFWILKDALYSWKDVG